MLYNFKVLYKILKMFSETNLYIFFQLFHLEQGDKDTNMQGILKDNKRTAFNEKK